MGGSRGDMGRSRYQSREIFSPSQAAPQRRRSVPPGVASPPYRCNASITVLVENSKSDVPVVQIDKLSMRPALWTSRGIGASFFSAKCGGPHCSILIAAEQVAKIPLAEDNDMVQAISADRTDEPFGVSIGERDAVRTSSISIARTRKPTP
jgi:hypothetical protein